MNINKVKNDMINRLKAKFDQSNIKCKLIDVADINVSDLHDNQNRIRFSGESKEKIVEMMEHINNGEYDPYRYIPPVVESRNNKYIIISGHHRHKAHLALKQSKMLCVVVEFETERDRSIWRQLENTKNFDAYSKNISSWQDNIIYISNLIKDGVIPPDRNSIEDYVLDAKLTTKKAEKTLNTIVNEVLQNTGNHKTQDFVKSWESSEKKEVIEKLQEKFDDKKFISGTFKELQDIDYDHRTMLQITDSFIEDPTRPIVVVYAVNGANKDKIEEIRDYKPDYLVNNFLDRWTKVVELQKQGYDLNKLVILSPLPQFGSEIVGDDNGVSDYINKFERKHSNKSMILKKIMDVIKTEKDTNLEDALSKILDGDFSSVTV